MNVENIQKNKRNEWIGLLGEKLQIYTASGSSKVQWESFQSSTKPLTWYKVYILSIIIF